MDAGVKKMKKIAWNNESNHAIKKIQEPSRQKKESKASVNTPFFKKVDENRHRINQAQLAKSHCGLIMHDRNEGYDDVEKVLNKYSNHEEGYNYNSSDKDTKDENDNNIHDIKESVESKVRDIEKKLKMFMEDRKKEQTNVKVSTKSKNNYGYSSSSIAGFGANEEPQCVNTTKRHTMHITRQSSFRSSKSLSFPRSPQETKRAVSFIHPSQTAMPDSRNSLRRVQSAPASDLRQKATQIKHIVRFCRNSNNIDSQPPSHSRPRTNSTSSIARVAWKVHLASELEVGVTKNLCDQNKSTHDAYTDKGINLQQANIENVQNSASPVLEKKRPKVRRHNRLKTSNLPTASSREKRHLENKKRREKLEKERCDFLIANSVEKRQARLKEKSTKQKQRIKLAKLLILHGVILGGGRRISLWENALNNRRQLIRRQSLIESASLVISKQIRLYCERKRQKKIDQAIRLISGVVFTKKIRSWRDRRRNKAADVLHNFLTALNDSGAFLFLDLMTKGKRWHLYREKIMQIQKLWRKKFQTIEAQVKLIDKQWQKEQSLSTDQEVERIYASEKIHTNNENELIDATNRMRKAMVSSKGKKRSSAIHNMLGSHSTNTMLPKKKISRKSSILKRMIYEDENDILSIGHIVPFEFRYRIIRAVLKYMKQKFMDDMENYRGRLAFYEKEMSRRESANTIILHRKPSRNIKKNKDTSSQDTKEDESTSDIHINLPPPPAPVKPMFKPVLRERTIKLLLELGNEYVLKVRKAWDPSNVTKIELPECFDIGRQIAESQHNEINT